MKVLVYTSLYPNPVQPNLGIFIKQRMVHFSACRMGEIKVVAPVPYAPAFGWLGERWGKFSNISGLETPEGIEVYHPRYFLIPKISMPMHGLLQFVATLGLLRKIYKKFPFDMIDGHYIYPDGLAAVLAGKVLGVPVVLSARGSDINEFPDYKSVCPQIQYALRHADHLISVSAALKRDMMMLGVPGDKIDVVPNGVDTRLFYPINREQAKKRLGLPLTSKMILSVGGLIPRKGVHLVLDSLPELIKRHPGLIYCVVGSGEMEARLKRQAEMLGVNKQVRFIGPMPHDQLVTWYNAADLFCLASEREGWANVIMESLACGTPVAATKVYGAPEIITTDDVGILMERKGESIFQGLDQGLRRNWNRDRIVAHVENASWENVALKLAEIFSGVLINKRKMTF